MGHSQQETERQKAPPPKGLSAVEYDGRFLEASWRWLNDPEVRTLSRTPAFTREDQRVWFNSLPHKSDYCIWGIELNGVPIGAMGFKYIASDGAECWGYIGEKSLWGQHIGRWMMCELIELARQKGWRRIVGRVIEQNTRITRICSSLGFVETEREGNVLTIEKDLCS